MGQHSIYNYGIQLGNRDFVQQFIIILTYQKQLVQYLTLQVSNHQMTLKCGYSSQFYIVEIKFQKFYQEIKVIFQIIKNFSNNYKNLNRLLINLNNNIIVSFLQSVHIMDQIYNKLLIILLNSFFKNKKQQINKLKSKKNKYSNSMAKINHKIKKTKKKSAVEEYIQNHKFMIFSFNFIIIILKVYFFNFNNKVQKYQEQQQILIEIRIKMIKSLYQINTSLQSLRKQLLLSSSNNEIKYWIDKLLCEVKYLDEQQKSRYYFLISQIYATRLQNIEQAENQLNSFNNSLHTEIYMNCQFRFGLYKYFQSNYKQANKNIDTALGYVQQQLKLTSNAKFFINRVMNKQHLQKETKQNKNFQASFILSQIYQYQKNQTKALKLIESFLHIEIGNFQIFQIYRKLLQLYELMTKNHISTISISKKSLQKYKQQLNTLKNKYPNFQQDYNLKVQFIKKMIKFLYDQKITKNQRQLKKMLDLKLLSYYKLKKCSKLAPNKQIKLTLMNSAKLIKQSKNTQLLEQNINYNFVKNQYQKFKVLYKYTAKQNLVKWQFINNLAEYSPPKQSKAILKSFKPPINSSKNIKIQLQQINNLQNIINTKPNQLITKPKQIITRPNQIIKKPKQIIKEEIFKQQEYFPMKEITSEFQDQNFEGSIMIKINASSQGYEERYFYIKLQNLKQKPKLYYCNMPNQKNDNDSYYNLKGLKEISVGKQTQAFQRKDTAKFNPGQCFSLIFGSDKQRNFYVPKKQNFHKWIFTLQTKLIDSVATFSKTKSNIGLSQGPQSSKNQIKESMQMKKSRKIVQFD